MTVREAVIVGAIVLIMAAIGVAYWQGRGAGAAAEAPKTAIAQDDAAGRRLEAEAGREMAAKVDQAGRTRTAAAQISADAAAQARSAPDATTPLDPARADRLSAADRRLCELAPELVGCEAAGQPGAAAAR